MEKDFNPELEIFQQLEQIKVKGNDIDWKSVKKGDMVYISSKFDQLEWWKHMGPVKYSIIYFVAPSYMAFKKWWFLGTYFQHMQMV